MGEAKQANTARSQGKPAAKKMGRPAGSSKANTILKIQQSALRIFSEKGYSSASFKDISKDIGVTPATIYQYFDSKLQLYVSIFDDIYAHIEPGYQQAIAASDNLRGQLKGVIKANLSIHEANPHFSVFLASATIDIDRDEELRAFFSGRSGTLNDVMTEMFDQARERGEVPADLDSENMMSAIFGALVGIQLRQRGRKKGSVKQAVEIFLMLIENEFFNTGAQ